ncbi:MAG: pyrroloquinoline quinone biosynthesis protein PqqF [Pseudomonas sp.]|uniref:pyrroloquinoline quinone biosynthesis protein PqqF n=1 Tax=Pseudomonas abieticivorans TaxID=2931382 RepID=UPI0020BD656E|nr:pyrroloquinoline quinone biosynthesis protein PqqF [Pseudomonas sp. PIA16]MDE1166983.1 pyrroloquinoline quinone biosynthesis protein PqqF [Pseudomonas sp.]
MSDAYTPAFDQMELENGLRVQLRHEPRLKRAAASLRVAAGSHDVPSAWPGLAHFLEHLFFLGTARYSRDQGLMTFVQRHGGQLNASTRERTTDFFFELPVESFPGALERLCEMLAHPRLDVSDQLREREVLHAEFIAWSRDPQARHQQWLTSALAASHPLRAFHAGNRYSLPVPREAFQQDLQAFYRRYYHAGQMTLCLAGPQPLEQLQALARKSGSLLPSGTLTPQAAAQPLRDGSAQTSPCPDDQRFNLVFPCEGLPEQTPQAMDFLATWIASAQPGGLLAELRRRGLVENLSLTPFYRFADQALVNIELRLTAAGKQPLALISQLCFEWLEFFQSHDGWHSLRDEYTLLQQRHLLVSGALALARHDNEHFSDDGRTQLSETGVQALRALLEQLRPDNLLHPVAPPTERLGQDSGVKWRLPQRNRFLRPSRRPEQAQATPAAMEYLPGGSTPSHEACVYVRWRVNASQRAGLWRMLDNSLHKLREEARQAGVQLTFSSLGNDWQLRLQGVQEPMPALLEQALDELTTPTPETWRQARQPSTQPALIPIRELLKRLPEHCLGHYQSPPRIRDEELQPMTLQRLWGGARWDGMAVGLSPAQQQALNAALRKMPGKGDPNLITTRLPLHEKLWSEVALDASEHAVLLFCPTASTEVSDEAAWRVLAHLCQAPYYQRMRVDLQLGYAVFSGFRQIAGRAGLLFGVQSPSTPLAEIIDHLQAFVQTLPALVRGQNPASLASECRELASRSSFEEQDLDQASEALWQARLAGHPSDFMELLRKALLRQRADLLEEAAEQVAKASAGWLCLANGPAVDETWQVAK